MKKVLSIIGARPQFIKHAPMQLQLQKHFNSLTLHTGQHYDSNMSDIFFNDLNIPQPDFLMNIGGSKPQGEQTGMMMAEIENVCDNEKPDALLIYGDTNSTLAGALVAAKMNIPIIHIEAGLRSYNRQMSEEVNRIVADQFADILFCPTDKAVENLQKEGIKHEKIFVCGDVMCDMLELIRPKVKRLLENDYYFATIHRPYNTDDIERLKNILNTFNQVDKQVVFSIHPRTVARMKTYAFTKEDYANIHFIDPVGYVESISYQSYASCVITDSGGMQKEAYMLQKKCITLRSETEWTETLQGGWNTLLFEDIDQLQQVINTKPHNYIPNIYGNGHAAEEIVRLIKDNI